MRSPAPPRLALLTPLLALVLTTVSACGPDADDDRTYRGVRGPACETLGTPALVTSGYPGLQQRAPRGRIVEGDPAEAVCALEATADPDAGAGLPGDLAVSVTVSTYEAGEPADQFDRLADYADDLVDPATTDDVVEDSAELGDGWWDRGTSWRTSWTQSGSRPEQLVETAAASRDNLLVTVLVIERELAEGSLAEAIERVHRLVEEQLDAALAVATTA